MPNKIKYPIAPLRATGKLIHIKDAINGLSCGCYCLECKSDLIAVNGEDIKVIPHFRHHKEAICEGNIETYVHKLAKELLKSIPSIKIPEIKTHLILGPHQKGNLKTKISNLYDTMSVPDQLRQTGMKNSILQESQSINIDEVHIEKQYESDNGNVVIDVVLESKGSTIFIEPFFSNPIDSKKLKKLESIDIPTISINLRDFTLNHKETFEINDLLKYLISEKSKEWVVYRSQKRIRCEDIYLHHLKDQLINKRHLVKLYEENQISHAKKEEEFYKLNQQMLKVKAELNSVESELIKTEKEFLGY